MRKSNRKSVRRKSVRRKSVRRKSVRRKRVRRKNKRRSRKSYSQRGGSGVGHRQVQPESNEGKKAAEEVRKFLGDEGFPAPQIEATISNLLLFGVQWPPDSWMPTLNKMKGQEVKEGSHPLRKSNQLKRWVLDSEWQHGVGQGVARRAASTPLPIKKPESNEEKEAAEEVSNFLGEEGFTAPQIEATISNLIATNRFMSGQAPPDSWMSSLNIMKNQEEDQCDNWIVSNELELFVSGEGFLR